VNGGNEQRYEGSGKSSIVPLWVFGVDSTRRKTYLKSLEVVMEGVFDLDS
jgi:hypothetical protein